MQFERLYRTRPERYAYHEAKMEQALAEIGPTARPFLRKVENGVTHYLTLKQLREQLDAGTAELPMFDDSGCGCFTDA